jgi:hypothetical protein
MRLLKVNKADLTFNSFPVVHLHNILHLIRKLVVTIIEKTNHFNVASKGDTGNPKFENKFTG